MRTPEILNDRDAEAQAAQARRDGCNIVRDHLSNHLQHNGGRSSDYVSWIATLHPENAEVTVDQRFFIPGNPWWTIYEEGSKSDIPSATAVPITEDEENVHHGGVVATAPFEEDNTEQGEAVATAPTNTDSNGTATPKRQGEKKMPSFFMRCSPVDLLVSFMFISHTILAVLMTELMALLLYMVAALFYRLADCLYPPNIFTGVFYSICILMYYSFAVADSILLLASVFIAEVMALVGWIVSVLFGGIWVANYRHQYVRRACHHIRSIFRSRFTNPPRHFAFHGLSTPAANEQTRNNNHGEVVAQADVVEIGREDRKDII